jgi:hypothetical protein
MLEIPEQVAVAGSAGMAAERLDLVFVLLAVCIILQVSQDHQLAVRGEQGQQAPVIPVIPVTQGAPPQFLGLMLRAAWEEMAALAAMDLITHPRAIAA